MQLMQHIKCLGMGVALIGLITSAPVSAAAFSFTYDFPGSPGSGLASAQTATQPSGIAFSDFSRVNVTSNNAGNIYNSSAWNTTATIDTGEYVQFSLTTNLATTAVVTKLDFTVDGSDTVADEFQVLLSTNGFSTFSPRGSDTVPTSPASKTWDFSDITLSPGQTLTFRFFVFGDTQADTSGVPTSAGTFSLDNVVVTGTVPEPASVALLAMGGLAGLRRRRSK